MLKRILALALCLLTVGLLFASCGGSIKIGSEDQGDIINAYITSDLYAFDPGKDITDESSVKLMGLLYEGLFRLDKNGKPVKALADKVKIVENSANGEYKMQISIKKTKWSNGMSLTADDFVFAWKRLMEPSYKSTAAALLYDVKNARDVKAGDASVDDLGVVALDTYLIEITFETKIDYDNFKKNLASVALVPLREDTVATDPYYWSRRHSTIVTNGPFAIKGLDRDEDTMRLERNLYYYRDVEEDKLDKFVKPYRININFVKTDSKPKGQTEYADDLAAIYEAYKNGEVQYIGDIPVAERESVAKKANLKNANSTYAYLFNTNNKIFADARVRRALSLAIDRNAIAEMLVYAAPATGLVADTVFNATSGKTYRDVQGDLLSVTADLETAKTLLKEAGVKSGSFTLKYRDNEAEKMVAEYVKGEWEKLGFKVTLEPLTAFTITEEVNDEEVKYRVDSVQDAYENGDFDVIAVDISMYGTDAFAPLAVYATEFSGNGIDMKSASYDFIPHVTGYSSADYDAIIERAFETKNITERAKILFEAETLLMQDAPVVPLVFNKDYYLASGLKNIGSSYLGYRDFSDLAYPAYKYVPEEK